MLAKHRSQLASDVWIEELAILSHEDAYNSVDPLSSCRGRPDCTLPASASSESSRSLGDDGRRAWSPFLRFLIGDHGVWGPCRGILYFMPLSESKSTRTVVSNAVGVCAMSMMRQLV